MRYIVTGGAGFIGSHVVESLLGDGHTVLVIDNFSTGSRENLRSVDPSPDYYLMEGDIRNYEDMRRLFNAFRPDAVIHLAAQAAIATALENPRLDLEVNAGGTLNIARAAQEFGAKRFVYASTSAVYHDIGIIHETGKIQPGTYYGISKRTGEMYVGIADTETVILRFGNVYGPRQVPIGENQVIARAIRHLLYGDEFYIFGDGEQARDFIYVEDVADAVKLALTGKPGIYNIAGGESYSVNEVAKLLAAIVDYKDGFQHDLSRMDERRNVRMEIEAAHIGLGWKPKTEFMVGLVRTVKWWKDNDQSTYLP